MEHKIQTFRDLINAWPAEPSAKNLSTLLGVKPGSIRTMKCRDFISPQYHRKIIKAAKEFGLQHINDDLFDQLESKYSSKSCDQKSCNDVF